MPKCPRCATNLTRAADGSVPSACPGCGAKFKVVKRPEAAPPPAPPPPDLAATVEYQPAAPTQPVRKKLPVLKRPQVHVPPAGRAAADPFASEPTVAVPPLAAAPAPRPAPAPDPFAAAPAEPFDGDPFESPPRPARAPRPAPPPAAAPPRQPSYLAEDAFATAPAMLAAEPDLDFVTRRPAADPFAGLDAAATAAPAEDTPFESARRIRVPAQDRGSDLWRNLIVGALALGAAGGGAWVMLSAPKTERASKDAIARHSRGWYEVFALPAGFKADERRMRQANLDLAFHRPDARAWITVRSEEPRNGAPPLGEAADRANARWEQRLNGFQVLGKQTIGKLSEDESRTVSGTGTLDGVATRIDTVCAVRNGVVVEVGFEAPADQFAQRAGDFKTFRDGFRFGAARSAEVKLEKGREVAEFASKKYPYRLQAPARQWREQPDLITDSRFDDLKLTDGGKLGVVAEIVVSPRESAELEAVRSRFIDIQKRRYLGKVKERPVDPAQTTVKGRRVLRLALIVDASGAEYLQQVSVIQGDHKQVYLLKCQCPADKRDLYEPIFQAVLESFEVLPSDPPKEKPAIDPPPPPPGDPPGAKAPMGAVEPTRPPLPKPEPKAEPKPEPKAEPKLDAKAKAPDAKPADPKAKTPDGKDAKTRKALDDLD